MAMRAGEVEAGVRGFSGPPDGVIAHRIVQERSGDVLERDPAFVRRFVPSVARCVGYFSPEVRGISNLPATGPVLVIGNHCCLFYMPDTWMVALAITGRRGAGPRLRMPWSMTCSSAFRSSVQRCGVSVQCPPAGMKPSAC